MVFLSYAKEDEAAVHRIYRELRYAGLQPWMDKPPGPWSVEGIGPGEEWEAVVRQRLAEAELLLVFLSKGSIVKHGYVQREYRMALDIAATKPAGSVFLIPILLEDCEPPDLRVGQMSLRQFQWYRLFELGISPLLAYIAGASPARRPPSHPARPRVTLQQTLVEMFSLQDLPSDKAAEMVNRLGKLVFQAVLGRVLPMLSEEHMGEYERLIDSHEDMSKVFVLLAESVPDFDDIVHEEADALRAELSGEFKEFDL